MDIFSRLMKEGKLTASLIKEFEEEYGKLFYKALEFLQKSGPKIKKHTFFPSNLEMWTVQGAKRKYVIYPDIFCQCQSFLLTSIYRKKHFHFCKHLLAYKIALALNQFEIEDLLDSDFFIWSKVLK
ncbi:hypothetical protein [Candidatus Lokiarchaeum ossiferum]|uniref:hypothetical protein n=1 Tax=Candidatus Lokiarchaeum ossiferum TaxID=2951803 RepID=UPI00352DDB22